LSQKNDLTFSKGKETLDNLSISFEGVSYFEQFKNKDFKQFNDIIGLPRKKDRTYPIFEYEYELLSLLGTEKHVWIKKATGLGITEFTLRWIAWMSLKDDNMKRKHKDVDIVIITGPRLDLAITLMDRLKGLFSFNFTSKNTVCELNGVRIEAFPSHHLAAARGLSPQVVFLDEADFFPPKEQQEARSVSERYIAKSNPWILMVSTPFNPGGLYEQIENEEKCLYQKVFLDYTVGLRDGMFTDDEIRQARESPSFEREYNLKYGVGEGNIFPYELVDECIESFDLSIFNGTKLITVDPAYGSSNFAICGFEKLDNLIYVKDAEEHPRPSPSAMLERLLMFNEKYGKPLFLVDSAHPGLIRDLKDRGVNAMPVNFGAMSEDNKQSLISKMTFEASQAVREKRVRIHTSQHSLTAQLKAVRFNDKGHPDKKELNFDLGDCFIMAMNHLKVNTVRIIKV
jgi:hypothetical protein